MTKFNLEHMNAETKCRQTHFEKEKQNINMYCTKSSNYQNFMQVVTQQKLSAKCLHISDLSLNLLK